MRFVTTAIALALVSAASSFSQAVSHGTINILLANGNGIVLITDSRASDRFGKKLNDVSQKLFQIDSTMVCSIAGFGTDPGPHWELRESAGGVISSLAEGMTKSPLRLSFRQKISIITEQLAMRLAALETEYHYAEKTRPPSSDELIMLFAGFDVDGGATIAKVYILVKPSPFPDNQLTFRGDITDLKIQTVGRDFVYLTSGVDDSAKYRLSSPKAFKNEAELKEYGRAVHDGHTSDLNTDQLERLGRYLELDASRSAAVIGGPPQIAVLANKQIQVTSPANLIVDPRPYTTGLMDEIGLRGSPLVPPMIIPPHAVFVNGSCENTAIILDGLIIIGGKFVACNFYFDGEDFYRDPTVVIEGGRLILGPHVSTSSYFFEKALKSLPELAPMSYKDLPNPEAVLKRIWPQN
jgi:hypothetical protein